MYIEVCGYQGLRSTEIGPNPAITDPLIATVLLVWQHTDPLIAKVLMVWGHTELLDCESTNGLAAYRPLDCESTNGLAAKYNGLTP